MLRMFRSILLIVLATSSAAIAGNMDAARKEMAPFGTLRFGVVSAPKPNVFFVIEDGAARPHGVTVEIAEELARSLGVSSEFFVAHNSGEITDALENGRIDAAFLPVDEERKSRVAFGPAYVTFDSTCLVLGGSEFRTVIDLDRPGVRVGGEANTTTIRSAARVLKSATIVPLPSVAEGLEMLRSGQIDAFALGRTALAQYQADIPGSRILEGAFHTAGIAIAVPKNRLDALAYVTGFINDAKASGLIRRAFDKAGLQSTPVAPAD
jgi:polar amino acid transport system substrate-binding protein